MWLNPKFRNRRLGNKQVLDVKLRSAPARQARLRLITRALGAAFATLFAIYVVWRSGEWALNRFVYENKSFAIRVIDIQSDGSIVREQLRRWAGVQLGQNLMALDLARVQRDLEMVPVIQEASIERILPHTLRIRVLEREAVAHLAVPRRSAGGGIEMALLDLDSEGYVMQPLDPKLRSLPPSQPSEMLPVLTNVYPNDVRVGRRLMTAQVQASLQLLACFEHSPMVELVDLRTIDVSASQVLVVTTGQGNVITLPLTDLERQLRRWRGIHDLGQQLNKSIATLDLAITDSMPARWLEANAAAALAPRPAKPIHLKKKHV